MFRLEKNYNASYALFGITAMFLMFLFFLFCFALYFLPSIVAFRGRHENALVILIVNTLFGWTILGWLVCIVLALQRNHAHTVITNVIYSEVKPEEEKIG